MAWNRPRSDIQAKDSLRRAGTARPTIAVRGAIAGAVIAIGVAVAAWWLWPRDVVRQNTPSKEKGLIREATPAAAPKAVEKPKKKPYKDMTNEEKLKSIRERYGDNIPEKLKPTVYFLENPPQQKFHAAKLPSSIFKRKSERQLAEMLLVEPGQWMLRKPEFDARFDKDFAEACQEKIEFSKDDTDFQRDLKQTVIDTKAELAERIAKGEKASDIMNDFSSQLYDLGQYRKSVEEMVREVMKDPKMKDGDIEDCVKAANEMLSNKGAMPLKMPNLIIRRVALKHRAAKEALNENKE